MHSLYKQENLPYLNVKLCPNCQELVGLEEKICSKCTYNFETKLIEKEEEEKKKKEEADKKRKEEEEKKSFQDINYYIKKEDIPTRTVESKKEQETVNNDDVDEFGHTRFKGTSKGNEKVIYCDKCGSKIYGEQQYCGGCGAKVTKKLCISCNNIIDNTLAFCPYCGEKHLDIPSSIEETKEEVNSQVITSAIKKEDVVEEVKTETTKIEVNDINKENKENVETTEKYLIKMTRKRIFVSIQMVLVTIIVLLAVMLPIMSKDSFVLSIIPSFTNTSNETIVSGKEMVSLVIDYIETSTINIDNLKAVLTSESGSLIFSDLPLIDKIVNAFKSANIGVYMSALVVLLEYALIAFATLFIYITSIIGLIRKTPLKGKAIGMLTIMLAVGCLLIYTNSFTSGFNGYDSWIIYAFGVSFLLWFIIKIVFGKEARIYKKNKLNK